MSSSASLEMLNTDIIEMLIKQHNLLELRATCKSFKSVVPELTKSAIIFGMDDHVFSATRRVTYGMNDVFDDCGVYSEQVPLSKLLLNFTNPQIIVLKDTVVTESDLEELEVPLVLINCEVPKVFKYKGDNLLVLKDCTFKPDLEGFDLLDEGEIEGAKFVIKTDVSIMVVSGLKAYNQHTTPVVVVISGNQKFLSMIRNTEHDVLVFASPRCLATNFRVHFQCQADSVRLHPDLDDIETDVLTVNMRFDNQLGFAVDQCIEDLYESLVYLGFEKPCGY